ncbi:MAG: hypothetical protein EXS12_06035 [Phycisphaerales bacterium]|nr:hypothetical protein [Phycisphaerales bacterium]
MGQATLAFRNLLVRAAIFVVLAAALAWFVGGTLFGKHRVNFPAITWDGREWAAQVIGNGTRPDEVRWRLLSKTGEDPWHVLPISETGRWSQLVGPSVDEQGLWIKVAENASTTSPKLTWSLIRFAKANSKPTKTLIASVTPPAAQ